MRFKIRSTNFRCLTTGIHVGSSVNSTDSYHVLLRLEVLKIGKVFSYVIYVHLFPDVFIQNKQLKSDKLKKYSPLTFLPVGKLHAMNKTEPRNYCNFSYFFPSSRKITLLPPRSLRERLGILYFCNIG